MKQPSYIAVVAALALGFQVRAVQAAPPELRLDAPAPRSATVPSAPPCQLARSVVEQVGRLAPQIGPVPNDRSFGAANGEVKLVVACGITPDETYTYRRLLSSLGVTMLAFKGDEQPEKVIGEVAGRLALPYRKLQPSDGSAASYLFGDGSDGHPVQLTLREGGPAAADAPSTGKPAEEDIWELYLLAKSTDPSLGRSLARYSGSKADVDTVRAGLRPKVDAGVGINGVDVSTANYPGISSEHNTVMTYSYNMTVRAPLVNMPTRHNLKATEATLRSDEAGVTGAQQGLISKLSEAYFGILKGRADDLIAREEISRVRQALEQAQAFLKAGTGDIIAVYEAQARLDSVIADQSRSETTLKLAEQRLASIVGKPVSGIVDYLPKKPRGPEPDDLEWWLATLEERDPQIHQAREGVAGSQESLKAAKAGHLPTVDATGLFSGSRGQASLPKVETYQWQVGANLSIPIYAGGETSARVRRAVANESERRYNLDEVREQRREGVKQAFFNLRYNVILVRALEQKESSAQVQLNAIRKGRSIGTRTAIDLLNAEQAYSVAQRDLKNALYDNVIRLIQLKAAAGILEEADIRPASRTASGTPVS